jgi:hypothetical protein
MKQKNVIENRILQIDQLSNGDLVLGGNVGDNRGKSPTLGQWVWLMRTDSEGCLVKDCGKTILQETKNDIDLNVSPNPANNSIQIEISNPVNTNYEVSIFNVMGKQVFNGFNKVSIDVSNFSNGFYILKINIDKKNIFKNIIIQH